MLTISDYDDLLDKSNKEPSKLFVIDFKASWCGPCKLIHPYIKELSNSYTDVNFIEIDVDDSDHEKTVEVFGISAMPTFLFYKNNKVLDTVCGANKEEIFNTLQKNL